MRDGITREWIATAQVRMGDRISCLLSDASADLAVTGWQDKVIDLTRYDLGTSTYRHFTVKAAPWWAADMTSFRLDGPHGQALVLARNYVHYGTSRTACGEFRTRDTATTRLSDVACPECIEAVHRSA
ncbi:MULTISPECIES: hypothetical protein [unclassified Streptomyces]|uniref:hypothetical protein n=1 Tax=unclassified Streptomyces TaxID=2593676 RepID=UPI0035E21D3F